MKVKTTIHVIMILLCLLQGLSSCHSHNNTSMTEENSKPLLHEDTLKVPKEYRLSIIDEPAQLAYGNYYSCFDYPINVDKTQLQPDTIRLLLIKQEFISLMDRSETLLSSSLVAN